MNKERKGIEPELYRRYWDDGLLDLICGAALLGVGIGWWTHQPVAAAVVPVLLSASWGPLRRALIEPRAGYVEFSLGRQKQTHRGLLVTFMAGVGAFLLGIAVYAYVQGRGLDGHYVQMVAAVPVGLVGAGALIVARLTGAARFMIYGFLLWVAAVATAAFDLGPAVPMLMGGLLMTLSGLMFLARFLHATARFTSEV